jgi:hypothetical protein
LIANHLGYHFIGSDIKLALALKNAQWWKTKALYKHTLLFQFLKQDISQPLSSDHFSALLTHTSLIITEGRL